MSVSGEETPTPRKRAALQETPEVPEGFVLLDQKEHDRLQAEHRRATKALRDREAAEEAKASQEAAEAARAAGEFDEAVRIERERREALEKKLQERERRDAVRDEVAARELTGSKARMLTKLVDLGKVTDVDGAYDAAAAVDAVVAEYPDLFEAKKVEEEPGAPIRRRGAAPQPPASGVPFEGYISPEEYQRTPQEVRLFNQKFRERVDNSRAYWPKTFDARGVPQGNE